MGFADIVAQIVLIFLFIIIFTSLFSQQQSSATQRAEYNQFLYEDLTNKIQTDITIVDIGASGANNIITVKNTGSTTLDTSLMDVFTNGEKVSRSDLTFTLYNQTMDPLLFNPAEAVNISFNKALTGRVQIQVSTQYGISAYEQVVS